MCAPLLTYVQKQSAAAVCHIHCFFRFAEVTECSKNGIIYF